MKMTPLDVRQKRFEIGFRGYSQREVEGFLELAATEFEDVVRENIALKEEQRRTLARLEQHMEREKMLQETMITAQRICDDIKVQAQKEAELIIAQAELQGEKIIAGANHKLIELVREINELKRQRSQFESQVDSIIESHRKLLDTFKDTQTPDVSFFLKKSQENG